jgi:hypothetical protein
VLPPSFESTTLLSGMVAASVPPPAASALRPVAWDVEQPVSADTARRHALVRILEDMPDEMVPNAKNDPSARAVIEAKDGRGSDRFARSHQYPPVS